MALTTKKYISGPNPDRRVAPPLSKTDDESEGAHLRRVAIELSGSGEEQIAHLRSMLESRRTSDRTAAALILGKNGSEKSVQVLRDLLVSGDEISWRLAIHGLRSGGTREGWLCLESVAQDDADHLAHGENHGGTASRRRAKTAFRRLMAMGRTKMMDRLFRAADGHSRSIPGDVARQFSINAVATLPDQLGNVLKLRLGLAGNAAATPAETASALGIGLDDVRALELEAWQSIHSPAPIVDRQQQEINRNRK